MEPLLAVSLYELSVTVHVLATIVAFGPTFTFPIIQTTAERLSPRALPVALGAIERISRGIVTPVALVVGVTGLYQALDGPFTLGRDNWMDIGLTLWVLIMVAHLALVEPAYRRGRAEAERMVERAGPTGDVELSDEYRRIMRRPVVAGTTISLGIVALVYLMEVKPLGG